MKAKHHRRLGLPFLNGRAVFIMYPQETAEPVV
jgi:hypothetical protein